MLLAEAFAQSQMRSQRKPDDLIPWCESALRRSYCHWLELGQCVRWAPIEVTIAIPRAAVDGIAGAYSGYFQPGRTGALDPSAIFASRDWAPET